MQLTNRLNLPDALVAAIANDSYVGGGDISVTKLIDSPQIRTLGRKYKDSIVVDVSERIWALMGQAVHTVLERANTSAVVEQRLFTEVNGWKLSGQFDRMHLGDKTLQDWKVTTVFKADGSIEWEKQLNVLRYLAHKNGYEIESLQVIAIFRDWRRTDSLKNESYPPENVKVIDVPLWSLEYTEAYITDRIKLHQASSRGEDVFCTDEERWYAGTTYALMKEGGKRASKVSVSKEDLGEPLKGYFIEERKGGFRRCEGFCDVAQFCPQYSQQQQEQ